MKVLITGGAGFIGSHLCEAYLKRGDEVVIVDDLSSGSRDNIAHLLSKKCRLYELKIQNPELKKILAQEKPDLINHHAAQKSVRDSVTDPIKDADINLIGLLNLLEAARSAQIHSVIYASSGGVVYGEQEAWPAAESHAKRPCSPYGVSKYASELYLDFYVQQYGFHAACLRYGNIFGPRQDPDGEAGVVAIFSKLMKASQPTAIFGTGEQTRDFIYVKDVVAANLAAEKALKDFNAWNIGLSKEISILNLHKTLADVAAYRLPPEFRPAKSGEQLRSCLSAAAFSSATGWKPQYDLRAGLQETYEWFKSQTL